MSQLAKAVIGQINELNKLLQVDIDNDKKFQLKKRKFELYHQLDRIVESDLKSVKNTVEFKAALEAVKIATKSAKEAKRDIGKLERALSDATKAIGKIEDLVVGVVGVLAIF